MPAPMITMDLPRVFSALVANARAVAMMFSRVTDVMASAQAGV